MGGGGGEGEGCRGGESSRKWCTEEKIHIYIIPYILLQVQQNILMNTELWLLWKL